MRRIASLLTSVIVLIGAAWVALNYQSLVDHYIAATYQPSSQMSSLIKEIQPTDEAQFMLRATQASLDDRQAFNKHCTKKDLNSVTLGCYVGPQHLYVYNVTDEQLNGVRQVTLAHEMLHAAYDRLSQAEREKIDTQLEAALPSVIETSYDLKKRLEVYERTEPGERFNELHSILGTEVASLPNELEEYYKRYFTNRNIITDYAANYTKVFQEIASNQDQLVADMKRLNESIDQATTEYKAGVSRLNSQVDDFNSRALKGEFSSQADFEAERSVLQGEKERLDRQRDVINQQINEYEQKRKQLEVLNVRIEDLNTKLDSTKTPAL